MTEKKPASRKSFVSRVVAKVVDEATTQAERVFHEEPPKKAWAKQPSCPVDGSEKPEQGPCPVCGTP